MPEQPIELRPETPDILLDKNAPWYAKMIPWTLTYAKSNPGISTAIVGIAFAITLMWFIFWQQSEHARLLREGQIAVAKEVRDFTIDLEARREKREDVTLRAITGAMDRLTASHDKVAISVDRNTDAIRGKVFTPKNPKNE